MAQTDYRIADLDGNELFNFNNTTTGVDTDMWPDIENMNVRLAMDSDDYRGVGLSAFYNTGFAARSFVIRGSLLNDVTNFNMWRLSSLPHDRATKKIYLASNWFVYGLVTEVNFDRVTGKPNLWGYQVTITCGDPFIYYAATGGAPATDYQIKPGNITESSSNIDIVLNQSGEGRSFANIQPFFILQGGASTSVTTSQTISFEDQLGRTLTFNPPVNLVNNIDLVVCPYFFRESPQGYVPQTLVIYQVENGDVAPATNWVLDINPFTDADIMVAAGNDLVREFGVIDREDDSATAVNPFFDYYYPEAIAGQDGGPDDDENRIVVSSTGTLTNLTIDAQYLYRRM